MAGKSAPQSCWVTGLEYGLDTKGERRDLGKNTGSRSRATRTNQGETRAGWGWGSYRI